jgi:hypothetical protein
LFYVFAPDLPLPLQQPKVPRPPTLLPPLRVVHLLLQARVLGAEGVELAEQDLSMEERAERRGASGEKRNERSGEERAERRGASGAG